MTGERRRHARSALRIGIDIGGTKTHAVAMTSDGAVRSQSAAATGRGPQGVLSGILTVVHELADANGVGVGDLASVGIGIPGQVDAASGTVRQALNLAVDEWRLADGVQEALGIRPAIDNDVNAAALGARTVMAVPGSLAFLNLGTGVAAGLFMGGRLLRGGRGAAGEIGHVSIDPAGPRCDCGQRGCIEAFCGGASLARHAAPGSTHPLRAILAAAGDGDARAVALRDGFANGVAAAVRVLVLSTDVEQVIIGGGVTALGDQLASLVHAALRSSSADSPFIASLGLEQRISFLPGSLNAPAIGAALLADAEDSPWK